METHRSSTSSPYQSLGDKPEMEFDLYEGQFQLGEDTENSLDVSGLNEELNRSSTCWGEDSRFNMGTVHQLQESGGRLQDDEECYQHLKQSNDGLVKKIFTLEQIIRDMEMSNIETARESERRVRETEQKLQLERIKSKDYAIRILELESDNATLMEKFDQLNCQVPTFESNIDQRNAEDLSCFETEREVFANHSSRLDKSETDSGCHLQDDQELVSELQSKLAEMESELRVAKDSNKSLLEQLQKGESISKYSQNDKSLAEEIKDCSQKERESIDAEVQDLKKRLASQEEANNQLQKYIDTVILNVMEKHPELLEVKRD